MTCKDLAELLIDYVDGELADEQAALIREHLAFCQPCSCYIETYKITILITRKLPSVEPPLEVLERLRAAAEEVGPD
jgi:anti-sigma factor RsiW